MGQTITQQTTTDVLEIDTFLLKYFQQYQKQKTLNKGLLMKTLILTSEEGSEPLVFKIFPKSFLTDKTKALYAKQIQSLHELSTLVTPSRCPNINQILQIYDLQAAGVLIRQYLEFNLRDRLGREPYLSQIDKKWICFQILYAVSQLHNCGICHGDIKLENVLLTTYHSVFLSDIALYKPTLIRIDDTSTYTYFFSNTQENKSCYLAPERLIQHETIETKGSNNDCNATLKPEMDVFSLGVLISEIFIEDVIINYSRLVDLKKGNLNLRQQLKNIHNLQLESLLLKMMEPDPKNRIQLSDAINIFAYEICPISIPRMLLHFNTMIICYNYSDSDLLVGMIYRYWKQIWRCLFNNATPPNINYSLSAYTLNKLTKSAPISKILLENFPLIFSLQNNASLDVSQLTTNLNSNNNHQSSIIIINYLIQVLLNLKYDANMIVCIDLLEHLTLQSSDIIKIDFVVLYLIKCLDKCYSGVVQMKALKTIMILLMSIKEEELILKSIDYKIYNYYIFEEILRVFYEGDDCLKILFVSYLDSFVELENKFLFCELNSKYQFLNPITSTKIEINTSVFIPKTVINHRENVILAQPNEILKDYEIDLNQFKGKIIGIITDIMSTTTSTATNKNEIQMILIRKLPQLIFFFGNKDIIKFAKLILDLYYQGNWLLQREIINIFPKIVLISSEPTIMNYYFLIIESILSKNANELLTLEMIHSVFVLFKMEFISSTKIIELLQKILLYILHPNGLIRNEIINLFSHVVQSTSHVDIYIYLWKEMKQCIDLPFIIITTDLIKTSLQNCLSRDLYQYICEGNDDSVLKLSENEKAIVSRLERKAYTLNANAFEIISNEVNAKVIEVLKAKENDFAFYQRDVMIKEMQNEIKLNNYTHDEDVKCVFEKIFGKLLFISDNDYSSIRYSSLDCVDYSNKNTNFYAGDCFIAKYLMKTLKIVLDMKAIQKNMTSDMNNKSLSSSFQSIYSPHINTKSLYKWKPKGQLVLTIDSNNNVNQLPRKIIKLLSCSNNSFLSFDNTDTMTIWSIGSTEWDINANKQSSLNLNEKIFNNKELISGNDNEFLIGSNKSISLYRIDSNKGDFNRLSTFNINNDVCCLKYLPIEQNNNNNNQFISVDKRGMISIYDIRMKQNALKYNYNTENGIVKSMAFINKNTSVLMGTSAGYLLNYDIRLNYIIDVFYYSNTDTAGTNTSPKPNINSNAITSIQHFTPDPKVDYDFPTKTKLNNSNSIFDYVFITTDSPDHEIGLWNMTDLTCGVLLKTTKRKIDSSSTIKAKEKIVLYLPKIQKEKNKLYYHRDIKENLQKYIDNQILQKAIKTSLINFEDDYNKNTQPIVNIASAYGNNSSINSSLCPYLNDLQCNGSYILTGGNDRIIRYWDFSIESMNNFNTTQCSIVAKPNQIESHFFTRFFNENITIIQSNEIRAEYCSEFAELTHQLSITDMIIHKEGPYLLSCGLDGLIKIWK